MCRKNVELIWQKGDMILLKNDYVAFFSADTQSGFLEC